MGEWLGNGFSPFLSFSRHRAALGSWSDSETVGQIDLYVAVAPHVVYEVLFVDIQKN